MEIPKRTPSRPVYKPTLYTPTQKPTHKPTRKPTSTSTHKPTHRPTPESTTPKESAKCLGKMFATAQLWNGTLIAPDGSIVDYSLLAGARFPYVDHVYNEPGGIEVGFSTELCVRLNDNDYWLCEGIIMDLYECVGRLAFSGYFRDEGLASHYAITGGTGDFAGATGFMYDEFDKESGYYLRKIHIA